MEQRRSRDDVSFLYSTSFKSLWCLLQNPDNDGSQKGHERTIKLQAILTEVWGGRTFEKRFTIIKSEKNFKVKLKKKTTADSFRDNYETLSHFSSHPRTRIFVLRLPVLDFTSLACFSQAVLFVT